MLWINLTILVLSLHRLFHCYQCLPNENSFYEIESSLPLIEEENKLFVESGICGDGNHSGLQLCSFDDNGTIRTLRQLQNASCYCDYSCHRYGDCCINRIGHFDYASDTLSCRTVKSPSSYSIPIYMYQRCPADWDDAFIKDLCETEALDRYNLGSVYDHRQDVPVFSKSYGIFYRNVYCAICNQDINLENWDTYLYCNGDSDSNEMNSNIFPDFTNAVYNPRTMNYRGVKINGKNRNCNLIIKNFELSSLTSKYGARLCKNVIDDCPSDSNPIIRKKCKMYSSYVYQKTYVSSRREVYKNFHCAMCNNVPVESLKCEDSFSFIIFGPPWQGKLGLTLLFDFNFRSEQSNNSCLLDNNQMWDPLFRRCHNVTCSDMYRREGDKCIPSDPSQNKPLKNNCLKSVLNKKSFVVLPDDKVYLNYSQKILARHEYDIYENDTNGIAKITICINSAHQLMPISESHYWLSVITLSISIVCLTLHLLVYSLFKVLRNVPGKNLMSLAVSLLCGHLFLLLGPHFVGIHWVCYLSSIITHFGYLSAFTWMNVMAFDIYKTFSVTQTQRSKKEKMFLLYTTYAWLTAGLIISLSIIMDNTLLEDNPFRPKYADTNCWFNQKYGLLLFFTIPVAILLTANIFLFIKTALNIYKITRQTKLVNKFSDKVRYFLYLKLTVVFGLAWILGFVAAITNLNVFWYPFIVLNGLQGALLFLSFTIKKNILNMLAVKLRLRSSKYQMRKKTGLKAAMYNSLSNLSSFPTTLSTQLSSTSESKEMLKAVRKINPDILTEKKL